MALAHPLVPTAEHAFALDAFIAGLSGSVILPGDEGYDEARQVRRVLTDAHPAIIVKAANAADVARTVLYARDAGLEIAVRGGAHSLAGYGTVEGGVQLDMTGLKGLYIDPERQLAWAGAGLTAFEYVAAAAEHGLTTPFGDTGSVGIAGLTLGGGIGWLVRKYGMTIDSLVSAEVVTADGRIVTASEAENPDLFWAIRGGGGNFGVVTRFQFKLYPVSMIYGGALFMPFKREVLQSLVPIAASAPEELTTITMVMSLPPLPFVPEDLVGQPTIAIMSVYAGDPADGEAALAPFRAVATPLAEAVGPMPYVAIYELFKMAEAPEIGVNRSLFMDTLDDAAIDAIIESHTNASSPLMMTQLRVLGGAMSRVPESATAFAHRRAPVMAIIINMFEDPAELPVHQQFTDAYLAKLRHRSVGVYSNFLEEEGEARIAEAYPPETYARLAEIKRRHDPANQLHRNQNIKPADPADRPA